MRKTASILVLTVILFLFPAVSHASEAIGNIDSLTQLAQLIVVGESTGSTESTIQFNGKETAVINYDFKVQQVVKNETTEPVKEGEVFKLTVLRPADLIQGQKYMLFLKKYFPEYWSFVMGGQSIFKIDKDAEGKNFVTNKINNKYLMKGVEGNVTGTEVQSLGVKGLSTQEQKVLKQIQGPIQLDEMVPLVKRIDQIKKLKIEKLKIEKKLPAVQIKTEVKNEE